MKPKHWLVALLSLVCVRAAFAEPTANQLDGRWNAALETPGGDLPFTLEFVTTGETTAAFVINGTERIAISEVDRDGETVRLGFPHYDSAISAELDSDSRWLSGTWRKVRGKGKVAELKFRAMRREASGTDESSTVQPRVLPPSFAGQWRANFESSDTEYIGVFEQSDWRTISGTFLTPTGDYRFLAGNVRDRGFQLSAFDGGHAFLFRANLDQDGSLKGDFWSGDWWHETWTAVRDDNAQLPDGFSLTTWSSDRPLSDFVYRTLDGEQASIADVAPEGEPFILEVFGSWCPNCHDAAETLSELHNETGIAIVGLAFELTEDLERSAKQVRAFLSRHDSDHPVLVAGLNNKDLASQKLPALDKIRAYPTTIFFDRDHEVVAVHTGFSGPATGELHTQLRTKFTDIIRTIQND